MDFFNNLGKKASEALKTTKEKTTKISGELKLKSKITDYKSKITDLKKEIGSIIYEEFKNESKLGENEEIAKKCGEIAELETNIKLAEEEILALKDIKKCISCGAELSIDMEYCSKCGTKQPEIVSKKEEVTQEQNENSEEPNEDTEEQNKNTESNDTKVTDSEKKEEENSDKSDK